MTLVCCNRFTPAARSLRHRPSCAPSRWPILGFHTIISTIDHPAKPVACSSNTKQQYTAMDSGNATAGYLVKELSVTADLIDSFEKEIAVEEPAAALAQEPWVKQMIASSGGKVVFSANGDGHAMAQHLSTGLSGDHLFLSLLQNDLIRDMVVIYNDQRIDTALRFGLPVCGHPTIVHGGLTSAIFDETFGVLLYTAGRYGHMELENGVFTARLEVDYKKPLPAESTVVCRAEVDNIEGRKIWVKANLTDSTGDIVYASSKALFVKPKAPVPVLVTAQNGVAANN